MNYKYDVFLSYSSYDNAIVSSIKSELQKNGISFFEPKDLESGLNFNSSVEKAISNCEFFVFISSSDFLREFLFRSDSYYFNGNGIPSHVEKEIVFANDCAINNGLRIIPVVYTKKFGDEHVRELLNDVLKSKVKPIIGSKIDTISKQISIIIQKSHKITDLFSQADQAWIYGAYEQAYNIYLNLVDLVEGDAKLNCYYRAANCCEKAGKWEEAKRLYHLSKNEQAIKRLEIVSDSTGLPRKEDVNQELLHKIANYCDASIALFYELLKNSKSPEGLNCLRTSYYRLLNYCKIIGGMDDIITSALSKMKATEAEFSRDIATTNKTNIDILKSYRTYLGLEFPESDNYDVFISYKSQDEMLARRVYDYLLSEGKRVFFACEVLPDMGKTEYRDAIMDALDHSQHFVLVTSKLEYITSNWVKEEWSFYVSKLIEDNHKGNLAIITHDGFKTDKNQLPPNLRYRQRLLMSNFKKSLLKYLQQ